MSIKNKMHPNVSYDKKLFCVTVISNIQFIRNMVHESILWESIKFCDQIHFIFDLMAGCLVTSHYIDIIIEVVLQSNGFCANEYLDTKSSTYFMRRCCFSKFCSGS